MLRNQALDRLTMRYWWSKINGSVTLDGSTATPRHNKVLRNQTLEQAKAEAKARHRTKVEAKAKAVGLSNWTAKANAEVRHKAKSAG